MDASHRYADGSVHLSDIPLYAGSGASFGTGSARHCRSLAADADICDAVPDLLQDRTEGVEAA